MSRKIYVPTFKNQTLEPRLAVLVTNEVIKQIQLGRSLSGRSSDQADATLEGSIKDIDRSQWARCA